MLPGKAGGAQEAGLHHWFVATVETSGREHLGRRRQFFIPVPAFQTPPGNKADFVMDVTEY